MRSITNHIEGGDGPGQHAHRNRSKATPRAASMLVICGAMIASSATMAVEPAEEILQHGETMAAMFGCAHFAAAAFGGDEAAPFFASGMDEGRAFYAGLYSSDQDQDALRAAVPLYPDLPVGDVGPEFALGYIYAQIEAAGYQALGAGPLPGSSDAANAHPTKARQMFSLLDCELIRP